MNGSILSVVALVIALAALAVSLVAFNRTSEENLRNAVEDQVEDKVDTTLQDLFGELPAQSQSEQGS